MKALIFAVVTFYSLHVVYKVFSDLCNIDLDFYMNQ